MGKVKVNLIQRTLHVANELVKLTPKEFDLIALLLANLESVHTRRFTRSCLGNGLCRRYTYGRYSHAAPSKKVGEAEPYLLQTVYGVGYKATAGINE